MDISIQAPEEMIETRISLPLSKSMSNRALIINALTPDAEPLAEVAACDDTDAMLNALAGGLTGTVNIGAAGTAMRFLTAYYAATPGADITLDGSERMRQRPIGILVDALRQCGADIRYAGTEGYPPLIIKGKRLHGGTLEIDASVSSQYLSAILMVAPTFDSPLKMVLKGEISSLPYLNMTIEMMRRRGIGIDRYHDEVTVSPGAYRPVDGASDIERDWSAASYWYSIAALSAGWITLEGMTLDSLQGDSRIAGIYEKLGVVTAEEDGNIELSASPEVFNHISEDLSDCPDIVQTLVVTCVMTGVPFTITGVSSLRIKETDRLEALRRECVKIGGIIEIVGDNTIKWDGRRMNINEMPIIDTYSDHRMAMAFAPAAQYISGIVIRDADVVNKSYPTFWRDMATAGYEVRQGMLKDKEAADQ